MSKYDSLLRHTSMVSMHVVPVLQDCLRTRTHAEAYMTGGKGFEQRYPYSGAHPDDRVWRSVEIRELYVEWQNATANWRKHAEELKKKRSPLK